jgi:hypothetical protein
MKRKLLTIVLAFFIGFGAYAQNNVKQDNFDLTKAEYSQANLNIKYPVVYTPAVHSSKATFLSESFDVAPATWTITVGGSSADTWQFVTDDAGNTLDGTPFAFVDSDGAGSVDMDEILESPEVDVSSATSLFLSFDQFYNDWGFGNDEVADVDVWDGVAWQNVYSAPDLDVGAWGAPDHQDIDVTAHINANFKVRFHYYNANFEYWWAIDNVVVYEPDPVDFAVTGISPGVLVSGSSEMPVVTIENVGSTDIDSWSVQLDDGAGYNETVNGTYTITAGMEYMVEFPDWTPADGQFDLTAVVTVAGDGTPENDVYTRTVDVIDFWYDDNVFYAFDAADWTSSGLADHIVNVDFDATLSDVAAAGVSGMYAGDFVGEYGEQVLVGIAGSTVYMINGDGALYEYASLDGVNSVTGFTFDNNTGYAYVADYNGAGTDLLMFDEDMTYSVVGAISADQIIISIAADSDGNLFGVGLDDNLYSIDAMTGAGTIVGPLGVDINYAQDIGFDRTTNTLFGLLYLGGGTGGLYVIDTGTGAATQLESNFGDELTLCAIYSAPFYADFNVDMNTQIAVGDFVPGTDVVYIAGSVWGWAEPGTNPDLELLDGNGDGIYSGTYSMTIGEVQYKYFDGPSWANGEWDGGDNRVVNAYPGTMVHDVFALEYLVTFTVDDGTNPIEGAMIDVNEGAFTFTTDVDGMSYGAMVDGTYTATVSMTGYETYTATIEVDGDNLDVDITLTPLSVEEIAANVNVFPNPSNGIFTIHVEDVYNLEVFDISGKVMNTLLVDGSTTIQIDTKGVYFLRFSNENESFTTRVIVQ